MADDHISFPLFKLVSTARSTYGLRHQDFARYKSHCTAKVHHLRKSTGLTQTAGRSKKYQRKDVTPDKAITDKHLQIFLFDSERCWAQSQLLKVQLAEDPHAPPSTKHQLAKRLAKAAHHAHELVQLSQDDNLAKRLSDHEIGQIKAYELVMTGTLSFERSKFESGLETLSTAYQILSVLASTASSATDEALVNEVMDEIEPMVRFCAYKLDQDTSKGVSEIAQRTATDEKIAHAVPRWNELKERLEEEGRKGKKEQVEVKWRGQTVPVRNVELVVPAVKVQQVLASLEEDQKQSLKKKKVNEGKRKEVEGGKKEVMGTRRMGTFDKALLVLDEAEQVASQLVDDHKIALSKGHSSRFEASLRHLTLFHSYVQYYLFSVRAKRDLLLIASTSSKLQQRESKAQRTEQLYIDRTGKRDPNVVKDKVKRLRSKTYPGLVKVYDTVLLSLEGMREMEVVQQDDELATKVEARIEFVRAQRCMYQSRCYALASQYSLSLALNARAKIYSRQARQTALSLSDSSASPNDDDEDDEDLVDREDQSVEGEDVDLIQDLLPIDATNTKKSLDEIDQLLEMDNVEISKEWFEVTGGKVEGAQEDDEDDVPTKMDSLSLGGEDVEKKEKKTQQPKFYDVAYNYVVAFDLESIAKKAGLRGPVVDDDEEEKKEEMQVDEEEEEEEEEAEPEKKKEEEGTPSKRGWGFGLFGRR